MELDWYVFNVLIFTLKFWDFQPNTLIKTESFTRKFTGSEVYCCPVEGQTQELQTKS